MKLTTLKQIALYNKLEVVLNSLSQETIEHIEFALLESPVFIDVLRISNDGAPSIFIRIGKISYEFRLTNYREVDKENNENEEEKT